MEAMRQVPRQVFVPDELQDAAYRDGPLPIGHGQTISQPYIVALMTDLLEPEKEDVMLEVGTGSGYQAAILSRCIKQLYSIEVVEPLVGQASQRLRDLGYENVETRHGDGYFGWPEKAPFDGIIVTAAAPHVPKPLVDQLKPGARLVIPVDARHWAQSLKVVEKRQDGSVSEADILDVAFVPLTGKTHVHPVGVP